MAGLIYANGNEKISAMIETMNLLDRISNTKIIVREAKNKWVSTFEETADYPPLSLI